MNFIPEPLDVGRDSRHPVDAIGEAVPLDELRASHYNLGYCREKKDYILRSICHSS